jgi:hypothetical protein
MEYYWRSYKQIYHVNQIVKHIAGYANPLKVGLANTVKTVAGQMYFRKKVLQQEHPFSMGLNRLKTR